MSCLFGHERASTETEYTTRPYNTRGVRTARCWAELWLSGIWLGVWLCLPTVLVGSYNVLTQGLMFLLPREITDPIDVKITDPTHVKIQFSMLCFHLFSVSLLLSPALFSIFYLCMSPWSLYFTDLLSITQCGIATENLNQTQLFLKGIQDISIFLKFNIGLFFWL